MSQATKTPADLLFEADLARIAAEDVLETALDEVAADTWEDYTYDWYDRSVEVYCNSDGAGADTLAAKMFGLGFSLCWVHPHPKSGREVNGVLCRCPARGAPQ